MAVYIDIVVLLNIFVDLLLLLGTNRLCGYPMRMRKAIVAALFGGLYGGICALPGFYFLGNAVWRAVSLVLMSAIAFGCDFSAARRGIVFFILSMALGGIATSMQGGGLPEILGCAGMVLLLCAFSSRGMLAHKRFVDLKIRYDDKEVAVTALCDTGNTLKDPITGESITVVGSDVARALLGLEEADLTSPVVTMERLRLPGLRLVPYRAVGQPNGMLLAMKMDEVWIGKENAGKIVAFAPQRIGKTEGYQALTGGVL